MMFLSGRLQFLVIGLLFIMASLQGAENAPLRTILVVGAHCGDAEITSGAVLAKHRKMGDRVVILHMTLGESGNPKMPAAQYGEQKRREALAAAKEIGAEVIFGPYKDAQLPNDESVRLYVTDVLRRVKPTHVITHWGNSTHRDHANTHFIVKDAVFSAALADVKTEHPAYAGIRALYYAENWEDPGGFQPYIYVDVTADMKEWTAMVSHYEFIRGAISSFPFLDYYTALARVRGAESGKTQAIAFDIEPEGKKLVMGWLP